MSIDEKIKAAWKVYSESSPQMKNRENFESGYRAALRDLFVEVRPEDFVDGEIYSARWKGQSWRDVYYNGEVLCYWEKGGIGPNGEVELIERTISPQECEVRDSFFPTPSEVFGEEG